MNKLIAIAAGISLAGVFLSACSTSPLQQDEFSPAQEQALNRISDMITDRCRAEGLTPATEDFEACYWELASDVRSALQERQEWALLVRGSHPLFANDRLDRRFQNRDNWDDRERFEDAYVERAQADEARGYRR